ncbi:alpha/beta fold hydrolase [Kitasatospora kifunensis]|uniref:Pimeloyl-ACP methyl ester carboxylesterase n=1 Tax=Kitasatospora kifunensis TaxID=58351 RepID=A0A7W7VUF7_KITKI|nr:alpha/beta hydrolase [Kitasatospora kifunensis]MBB4922440.1 pimeloyl-ACP methyl ester carboxylesterase [Kitasatospora kifunensis]
MTTNKHEADQRTTVGVPSDAELASSLTGPLGVEFRSEYATVNGLRLHYVAGGQGKPLVLLPGWPQTWWEYHKVMPALAAAGRRVIAVDLPGMGSSDKPATGYDKKTMASVIHALIGALGYDQVDLAGHDVGAQVAFSFAANHPLATGKVAMLDVLHPDASLYQIPMLPPPGSPFFPWWFAFNQVADLPEQLLAGRAHLLVDWVFDHFLLDQNAVSAQDRAVYARAYDTAEAIRGGSGWYQTFGQDIVDLGAYGKVAAPILGMVSNLGDGMFAAQMQATLPAQASDVRVVVVPNAGHYFVEEAPQAVIEEFNRFFV